MKAIFKTESKTENAYDMLFVSMFKLSMMIFLVGVLLGAIFVYPYVLMFAMFAFPVVWVGIFFGLKMVRMIAYLFQFTNHFKFRIMVGLSYAALIGIYAVLYLAFLADQDICKEWGVLSVIFIICTTIGFISARALPDEYVKN